MHLWSIPPSYIMYTSCTAGVQHRFSRTHTYTLCVLYTLLRIALTGRIQSACSSDTHPVMHPTPLQIHLPPDLVMWGGASMVSSWYGYWYMHGVQECTCLCMYSLLLLYSTRGYAVEIYTTCSPLVSGTGIPPIHGSMHSMNPVVGGCVHIYSIA